LLQKFHHFSAAGENDAFIDKYRLPHKLIHQKKPVSIVDSDAKQRYRFNTIQPCRWAQEGAVGSVRGRGGNSLTATVLVEVAIGSAG
jgi:hypothetical protein